jgi:hypothetical protein
LHSRADEKEEQETADTEKGIHKSPEDRNSSDGAKQDGMGENKEASCQTERDHPCVSHRITDGKDKGDGNDEMSEGGCPIRRLKGMQRSLLESSADRLSQLTKSGQT